MPVETIKFVKEEVQVIVYKEIIKEVEKIVEIPIEVIKIVEVPKEIEVEKIVTVEKIIEKICIFNLFHWCFVSKMFIVHCT